MELAAFASFGALVVAWIVLPLRSAPAAVPAVTAADRLADPVAA